MREVRVYDGDFPTWEQVLAGGPGAAFPKEVWLQQMQPGEFAVRYKDFKTGLARNPAGQHVQSSEICRIFENLEEARADSRTVVKAHWVVRCFIYDHTGGQVDTISNTKELNKFAALINLQLFLGIAFCALVGMALVWITYRIWLIAAPAPLADRPVIFGWLYWVSYAAAGLLLVALLVYLRFRWRVKRNVSLMKARLSSAISPEERKRFEELNGPYPSRAPAERERFLKLANEYKGKIREALKKR
jgi:hypothetical protein